MINHKKVAELKGIAKEKSIGQYGTLIGANIILFLISITISIISSSVVAGNSVVAIIFGQIVSLAVSIFTGILISGRAYLYMNLLYSQTVSVSDIFFGFKQHPEKAMYIRAFFTIINTLTGIPMIYFAYMFSISRSIEYYGYMLIAISVQLVIAVYIDLTYSQAFFLLHDFPDRSAKELLSTSRRLMRGNRLRLLYLHISFVPLYLLGCIAFFIPMLWVSVYQYATTCAFYQDLIACAAQNNTPKTVEKDGEYGLN